MHHQGDQFFNGCLDHFALDIIAAPVVKDALRVTSGMSGPRRGTCQAHTKAEVGGMLFWKAPNGESKLRQSFLTLVDGVHIPSIILRKFSGQDNVGGGVCIKRRQAIPNLRSGASQGIVAS